MRRLHFEVSCKCSHAAFDLEKKRFKQRKVVLFNTTRKLNDFLRDSDPFGRGEHDSSTAGRRAGNDAGRRCGSW